jgi:hypothetical protein
MFNPTPCGEDVHRVGNGAHQAELMGHHDHRLTTSGKLGNEPP